MSLPAELAALVDRARVVDTVVGAANAIDARDWARLRSLLADALDVDYREFRGEPPARVSADEYVAARRRGLAGLRTLHISTNHAVEIEGDRARCVSAYRIYRIDPGRPAGENRLDTAGRYTHELERGRTGWRICGISQTVVIRAGNEAVHGALRGGDSPGTPGAAGNPEAP